MRKLIMSNAITHNNPVEGKYFLFIILNLKVK
jgi:hypothetical protein